jgi:hypothetical protein
MIPVLCGCCALAVDFGYVELGQFQLQQVADASAHDYMVLYTYYNGNEASAQAGVSTTSNKVFTMGGSAPVVTPTWGYWNFATSTFSTTSSSGAAPAVKVVVNCKTIPLLFAKVIGQPSIGITATAIATSISTSDTSTVSANSNPYLAGASGAYVTQFGDTVATNGATQIGIPVVPGSFITFTNISGTSSVIYPDMPYYGPNGSTGTYGTATEHGQNWDGPILGAQTENGIGNAIMPESAFMGLFLDANDPSTEPTPSTTVNWTLNSVKNQTSFTNLALKSPFFIGDGTYNGTTQTFQVPAGATRLFLGEWDGVDYNNNSGSLTGTVNVQSKILIVQ